MKLSLPRFRDLGWIFLLTGIYFAAGKFGLSLAFVNASASGVWPPTGLSLAALLILGPQMWPAVFAGAFLVNLTTAGTFVTSLGIAAGNTLEAVIGAFLIQRFAGGRDTADQTSGVFKFIVFEMAATMIAATIGVATLLLGSLARPVAPR